MKRGIKHRGLRHGLILAGLSVLVAMGLFSASSSEGATLAAGDSHTCAVLVNGRVQCWGHNSAGQLGDGTTSPAFTPVTVIGITNAVAVGGGPSHSCAVLADGRVQCWGRNTFGQLGNGTTSDSPVPVTVTGITNAVEVAGGYRESCAVLADGRMRCWGGGFTIPVRVTGITDAVAVGGGLRSPCAVLADGHVQCLSRNGAGQLAKGTTSDSTAPVTVSGITNAVAVARGGPTCAVLANGRVQCLDRNGASQLGNEPKSDSPVPVPVRGITNAVAVASGYCGFSCALLADGRVKCWGHNHFGAPQKAPGVRQIFRRPVTIKGVTDAVAIAAGHFHICAVLADGRVQCSVELMFADERLGHEINSKVNGNCTGLRWRKCAKSAGLGPVNVDGLADAVAIGGGSPQNR